MTISAATIQGADALKRVDPGKTMTSRPFAAVKMFFSLRTAMWDRNPDRTAL